MAAGARSRPRHSGLRPAALLLCGAVCIAGCGGGPEPAKPSARKPAEQSAAAGLAVHRGNGFTVGYPRDWRPDPQRKIFDAAAFEVAAPAGTGGFRGSLSVFAESEARSMERLLRVFVARSKRSRDFRLIENRELDPAGYGGREAHVVRKAYTSAAGARPGDPLRQVDLFVRLSRTTVVNVRLLYPAAHYDAAQGQISAVLGSFKVVP